MSITPRHGPPGALPHPDTASWGSHAPSLVGTPATAGADQRARQVRAAEIRLLYGNATTGAAATAVIAVLLAYSQWGVVSDVRVIGWLLYVFAISALRVFLVRQYQRARPDDEALARWNRAFVVGTALAAVGWGAAALMLTPLGQASNETLVVFVVGGVMLGGASLLAPRPEALITFLLLTGLPNAIRLAAVGDRTHVVMGMLALVFTVVVVVTTWRLHNAMASSFQLRFDNEHLIENLRAAKENAEALNRELEFRVRDRTAKLMEADRRKDEFLATLAHELRNPLAPIRFALESLKAGTAPATASHARDVIERQIGQLVRLVDDLLDVSRITANKIQLRREPLELAPLMATAAESVSPLATAAAQTLDVQLPAVAVSINADGARLVQIFVNVLHNAVKFTPPGGWIWFTADVEAHEAVVRIRDNGIGIAKDVLPHVFDMFHQAEPVLDRTTTGLGIGLTLALRLVEMHEGKISIQSPGLGQGTAVEIRLPITTAAATTPEPSGRATVVATRRLRVLIVEDNVDAAEMLEFAVSTLGHETKLAHDGPTAITLGEQFAPDVIFLDIGLPMMNGYEVARQLRAMPALRRVHIAAVSGWGQEEDRRKAREAGCDTHFTKPLSPSVLQELLAGIGRLLQEHPGQAAPPRTRRADFDGAF